MRTMERIINDIAKILATPIEVSEANKIAASKFMDRVLEVIRSKGKEGCTDNDFSHSFKLEPYKDGVGEADLADYTLKQLRFRGRVRRETRYFLNENQ